MSGKAKRFRHMVVSVRLADVELDARGRPRWKPGSDEQICRVGGCWDLKRRRWHEGAGKPRGVLVLRFHRGQEPAARWLVEWIRRFVQGDWTGVARMFALLLIGPRRSGKTHLACAALIVFGVLSAKARLWAISPTLETGEELDANFRELLPKRWYTRRQAKTGRATTYRFANGSMLFLKSATKPARLKAGRVDMALINEAQETDERAFVKLLGAIADTGGLVLLTANPPDSPRGEWVETLFHKAAAGEADVAVFQLDAKDNPLINYAALLSMAKVTDAKTAARDVFGLFEPIGDQVFYEWSDRENWRDPWPGLVDITAEVSRRELGHAAGDLVGEDFQRLPSMVGIVHRVFRDPATGAELLFVVDEAIVDEADEEGLVDALEGMPRWQLGDGPPRTRARDDHYHGKRDVDDGPDPKHAAVVMDASGFFQDGEHRQNRSSEKWLRARDWVHLYKPQKDSDRNPAIVERMRTGNALLGIRDGVRRLFVARHCAMTAKALRKYENKNGSPNRRSQYAHVVDAVTYVGYRLYGRPKKRSKLEYRSTGKHTRAQELEHW